MPHRFIICLKLDKSNKRKWFYTEKKQEANDILLKLKQMQTMHFSQIYLNWAEPLQHSLEQARGIGFYVNANKTDFMLVVWIFEMKLDDFYHKGF